MSTVAEIAVSYAARGAQAAVRADRSVRDSIQTTAQQAQSESGTIARWMERHKSAITAIGAATAGVMGAILSSSPTMRSELAGVRMAFTLFADTVVNDVLPAGTSLVDIAFDIQSAYEDLPEPIREFTSAALIAGGVLGTVVVAGKALAMVVSGVLLAGLLAVTAYLGIFYTAWNTNFLGIREQTEYEIGLIMGALGWLRDFIGADNWNERLGMLSDLFRDFGSSVHSGLSSGFASGRDVTHNFLGWMDDRLGGLPSRAYDWGADTAGRFGGGLRAFISDPIGTTRELASDVGGYLGGLASDAYDWGADTVSRMGEGVSDKTDRFGAYFKEMAKTAANQFIDAFNAAVPSELSIPSVTLEAPSWAGGGSTTIGGQSMDLPQLERVRHGGEVERGGLARLHAGEEVIPAAEVSSSNGSGGGGGTTILNVEQYIDSGGSPQRTADKSADAVSQAIQNEFGARR